MKLIAWSEVLLKPIPAQLIFIREPPRGPRPLWNWRPHLELMSALWLPITSPRSTPSCWKVHNVSSSLAVYWFAFALHLEVISAYLDRFSLNTFSIQSYVMKRSGGRQKWGTALKKLSDWQEGWLSIETGSICKVWRPAGMQRATGGERWEHMLSQGLRKDSEEEVMWYQGAREDEHGQAG